jgi:hypothetical protein
MDKFVAQTNMAALREKLATEQDETKRLRQMNVAKTAIVTALDNFDFNQCWFSPTRMECDVDVT